jgi:formate dehydrogenase assembly factor FdhD
MTDYPTVTVLMNADLIEDLVLGFLHQNNLISNKERAIAIDLGLDVTPTGMVEVDVIYEDLDDTPQKEFTFEG